MKTILRLGLGLVVLMTVSLSSQGQVIYQDSFNRTGNLNGTSPDVVAANGATWTVPTDGATTTYQVNSGVVSVAPGSYNYTAAYLPINTDAADTVDGTKDFTLSATVTPGSGGGVSIGLFNGPVSDYNGANNAPHYLDLASWAAMSNAYPGTYDWAEASTSTELLTISYSASANLLTYSVNSTAIATESMTSLQVANLRDVAFGFDNALTSTVSTFQFVVAAPEPSTVALFVVAVSGLAFQLGRKRRSLV